MAPIWQRRRHRLALGIGLLLQKFVAVQSIALVFLTAVLVSAVASGLLPSLFACVAQRARL